MFLISELKEQKAILNNIYKPSRELSILNTKFEDIIIYLEAFESKLEEKKGE